ncbi:hypothetical protein AUR64_07915 [Haloprofundus marisrubri]|uniref:Uncharacterized protein n=1 Tax=Haloprofundus marisrubri TaxID=1514971 RepID=A0A0W1RAA2_9EURY|nr:hypothetical protein [Haloprofundus marisrubri]KTG10586.1 hypothetical protein AUR64_07915 [Haloprofundus marisrubri]
MTQSDFTIDRRTVLSSITGATLVGLAGCTSSRDDSTGSNGTASDGTGDSGPLKQVSVEGLQLVVELTADAEVEHLNVISPNGELFDSQELSQGVSRAAFELGTSYTPGEYRVLALRGEDEIGSSVLAIEPDLQIVEVGIGANHLERFPEELTFKDQQALVTVENRGTGPDAITRLLFKGDVPGPTTDYETGDVSGIWGPDANNQRGVDAVAITADSEETIFSISLPFSFAADNGIDCKSTPQSGSFRVVVQSQIDGKTTASRRIEYSESDRYDGCDTTISD